MSVPSERGSVRSRRREQVRDRVLSIVESLVEQGHSFAELSVETLAAEAGIARSTFYVYFEDKGDLLHAAIRAISEDVENAASAWWGLDGSATRDSVAQALTELAEAYRPHATLLVAADDLASGDQHIRDEIVAMRDRLTAGLRRHIVRGQRTGWIDTGLRPDETAASLVGMTERGHQHTWMRQADPEDLPRILGSLAEVVWSTLYEFAPARRTDVPV